MINRIALMFIVLFGPMAGAFIVPAARAQDAEAPQNQCIVCHTAIGDNPERYSLEDIHSQEGLSCTGCHGGNPDSDDPETAMSAAAGFVGVPDKKDIPAFCGKCHSNIEFMRRYQPRIATDQVAQYLTSVHGKRLVEGDRNVADCTSCHSAHGIYAAHDARSPVYPLNVPATCNVCHGDADYMKEYAIPTNQYEQYAKGVHGKALLEDQDTGAPACNDCHGNHGAAPPGVTSVQQVCGHCHVNNMSYFSATKMAREFDLQEMHGCEECHGNHYIQKTFDDMVGVGEQSVCTRCHSAGDEGYETAGTIRSQLDTLLAAYDAAVEKQKQVQRIGMDDVEIEFLLQESHQNLIQARTLVHTFDPAAVGQTTRNGAEKAGAAFALALEEIKDHRIRRRGFGIATIFITLLIVALFIKIRRM